VKKIELFFWILVPAFIQSRAATWQTFTASNSGLAGNTVRTVFVDVNGVKWFGTDSGLSRFDGAEWKTYRAGAADPGLAADRVNGIALEALDTGSKLWLATQAGVSSARLLPDGVQFETVYRPTNSPLPADAINAAVVDVFHYKWFGADKGAASFRDGAWGVYTRENYWINDNKVKCIATDSEGMNYFGTEGAGVSRLRFDPVDGITSASAIDWAWSGLVSDTCYAILIAKNGHEWYGTDKGLCLHTSKNTREDWMTYTTADGLADNFVRAIAEDPNGVKWFGTDRGASSLDGTSWRTYRTEDGLAGNRVYGIAVDFDGSVWFATDQGVSTLSGWTAVEGESAPERIALFNVRNFPNPFNSTTTLAFELPARGNVSVLILSPSGRAVRKLVGGIFEAGNHEIRWDGRDDRGDTVPSGVYVARIRAGGAVAAHKIIFTR
jgi:ligand-binding sensor domain-containing protein